MDALLDVMLAGYDRLIGLAVDDIAIDGCITKAPCGGEVAAVEGAPNACLIVESLLADLTGAPVRLDCDQGSPPRCRFVISKPARQPVTSQEDSRW